MLRCAQHDKRVFTKRSHKPMSNSPIPIKEFRLDLSELTYTGHDLVRPESILAKPDGTLWVSDGRGGVTRIDPDGQQTFLGGLGGEPNGLAMASASLRQMVTIILSSKT
jgi:sugar lactone lactonase YvrE